MNIFYIFVLNYDRWWVLKKLIIGLFLVTIFFIFTNKEDEILIPSNAIRFRVVANSNTLKDQTEKKNIKKSVEKKVYDLINTASNTDEVRYILKNNLQEIDNIVSSYEVPYNINYGYNYFPSKSYKGVLYGAGNYESLVITLGNGLGNNFWCVLFPPLCTIDESTEDLSNVEYKSYVKELIDKF